MHVIAALLLAVHGIAHLVGFRSAFWPSPIEATRRSYLRRKVDGVMWLLLTFGFLGCAALLLLHQEAWTALLVWSVAGSFVLCLRSWPEARIGLLINVLLFLLVLLLTPGNRAPFLVTRACKVEMASLPGGRTEGRAGRGGDAPTEEVGTKQRSRRMSLPDELPSLFGRFTAILQEHDHLGTTVRRLRAMCAALDAELEALPPELAPELLCAKLRADLTAHFGAEESLDYFGVVVDEAPSLAARIGSLKQEHAAMLHAADVLCELAQQRREWRLLADSARKLVGELERHERSESTLLCTLFFPK